MCACVAASVIALESVDLVQSDTGNKAQLSAIIPRSQKPARKGKGDVRVCFHNKYAFKVRLKDIFSNDGVR